MNVYQAKSGQLWFEVSRTDTHIRLHQEARTGWEMEPTELTLKEFSTLGYVLVYAGPEGLALAREKLGNVLLQATHPLPIPSPRRPTRDRSPHRFN